MEVGVLNKLNPSRKIIQVVVQHVPAEPRSPWHLIAYGRGRMLQPRKFHSLEGLLQAFRTVVPDLDESRFSVGTVDTAESRIIFTEELSLDEAQLSMLMSADGYSRPNP